MPRADVSTSSRDGGWGCVAGSDDDVMVVAVVVVEEAGVAQSLLLLVIAVCPAALVLHAPVLFCISATALLLPTSEGTPDTALLWLLLLLLLLPAPRFLRPVLLPPYDTG